MAIPKLLKTMRESLSGIEQNESKILQISDTTNAEEAAYSTSGISFTKSGETAELGYSIKSNGDSVFTFTNNPIITGVADPIDGSDVVTKSYADSLAGDPQVDISSSKLYVVGVTSDSSSQQRLNTQSDVYIENGVLKGAGWNDYAEYRSADTVEPGKCIVETSSGKMTLSTERLQAGAEIISDTFGFAIGEDNDYSAPVAVSGRVLAYPYDELDIFTLGAPVCSAPDGKISVMTREEAQKYPERILGTVSEIPNYKVWGKNNIEVNNRIWIRVR